MIVQRLFVKNIHAMILVLGDILKTEIKIMVGWAIQSWSPTSSTINKSSAMIEASLEISGQTNIPGMNMSITRMWKYFRSVVRTSHFIRL